MDTVHPGAHPFMNCHLVPEKGSHAKPSCAAWMLAYARSRWRGVWSVDADFTSLQICTAQPCVPCPPFDTQLDTAI
jgi:hypothetical protein